MITTKFLVIYFYAANILFKKYTLTLKSEMYFEIQEIPTV